jgi:hypothetical protein
VAAAETQVNTQALTESFVSKIEHLQGQQPPKLQEEVQALLKKSQVGMKSNDLTAPAGAAGAAGAVGAVVPDLSIQTDKKVHGLDKNADAHSSYSLSDMLYRETHVLGGVKEIMQGAKARTAEAIHDWPLTAVEVASGIAIGSALVLASRNPALATSMRVLNRTMLGIAAVDLTSRVAIPSYDALVHPENLEADRHDLGNRLGAAAVDYSMAAVAGGIGSRSLTPLIERIPLGSKLSGYDFLKTPDGAEVRLFKSGNALITKHGVKVFRNADINFDDLDPTAIPKRSIVGNNEQLKKTFEDAQNHPNKWREGKDVTESAGKFGTWFETLTGALASEVVERSADIGIGLLEHDYLVKTLEGPGSKDEAPIPEIPEEKK